MGISGYLGGQNSYFRIPTIGINRDIKYRFFENPEENEGYWWYIVSHEIAHLICSHSYLHDQVKILCDLNRTIEPNNEKTIGFLRKELEQHLKKEVDEIPLVVSEKIFKEVSKYSNSCLDDNCWWHEKIPGLGWPKNLHEIKREVWDKRD